MKSLFCKTVLTLGVILAAASLPVLAQSNSLSVKVPFAFYVGTEKMQAGDYTVSETTESGVLMIQSRGGKQTATVLSVAGVLNSSGEPSLVFARHGADVYLVRVQLSNEAARELPNHFAGATPAVSIR